MTVPSGPEPSQVYDHHADDVAHADGNRPVPPESVADLLPSMTSEGQRVPGIVFPSPPGSPKPWTVAAGHRRLMCCRIAGVPFKALRLPGPISKRELAAIRLTENVFRKSATAREAALDLRVWIDEGGCTQEEAAEHFGFSPAKASKLLALLRLPEDVQRMVDDGRICQDVGRIISTLPTPELQSELAGLATRDAKSPMKRGTAEKLAQAMRGRKVKKAGRLTSLSENGLKLSYPSDWPLPVLTEALLAVSRKLKR